MIKAPYSQIEENMNSYAGWCTDCGDWTHESCEPDARKYECPECGQKTCYGAEELLMQDMYEIDE